MLYIFLESGQSVDFNFYEKQIKFNKIFHSNLVFSFSFDYYGFGYRGSHFGGLLGSVRLFLAQEDIFTPFIHADICFFVQ